MDLEKLEKEQIKLALEVKIPKSGKGFSPNKDTLICSLDVQYEGDVAYVAGDVRTYKGKSKSVFVKKYQATVDYVPGFFSFREGPILLQFIKDLKKKEKINPDLFIVDGHGTAHPRQFGVACWLGVELDKPVIGVAKRPLVKLPLKLANEKNATFKLVNKKEFIGYAFRSQEGIKPIFVSAGNLISQDAAIKIIKNLSGQFRIIKPIRVADHNARLFSRGEEGTYKIIK